MKTFGTTTTASTSYGTTVQVSAQAPRVVPAPADDSPDPGTEYIAIDLRAHLTAGTSYYFSYISFSLFDPDRNACASKMYSNVLPDSKLLNSSSLGASTKDAAGSIIFQTKAGADLKKLTLIFAVSSLDSATVGWKS